MLFYFKHQKYTINQQKIRKTKTIHELDIKKFGPFDCYAAVKYELIKPVKFK